MANKSREINIYSWNVNGVRAVKNKGFDDWVRETKPDILCIQETKISKDKLTPEIENLPRYLSYWSCAERKGYSGTATFCKDDPLKVKYGFGVPRFDNEGRIVLTEHDHFFLFNIYFPNSGQGEERLKYKLDFYQTFLDYCKKLRKKGKGIIFCGDVNTAHREIDLENPVENKNSAGFMPCEREWVDRFIDADFVDSFRYFCNEPRQYTWWDYRTRARDKNIGWRIDYFFVDKSLIDNVTASTIHPNILGSDHCPISLTLVF